MMKLIQHTVSQLRKSIPFLRWYLGQQFYVLRKKGFKAAWNYFATLAFNTEDGIGLFTPLYEKHPSWFKYPSRIELEVTTKCFLKCAKCEQTYWNENQKNMSYEQFLNVMKQFPKLKAISLSGIGHNFQNPDFLSMVKYATDNGLYTQFFDTFLLWNDDIVSKIVNYGVAKIWMSIDGVNQETVNKLQKGSNFDKVVNNAKKLIAEKIKQKAKLPELGFTVVVTKYNVNQLAQFIDLFEDIISDAQKVIFVQFIRLIGFEENQFLMPTLEDLQKNREAAIERAKKSKIKFRLNFGHFDYVVNDKKMPIECCNAWTVPFITVDGTVYPCCALTEGNTRDLIEKYTFGNLFKNDFKDIWFGNKFVGFKKMISHKKVPPLCHLYRECTMHKTGPALYKRQPGLVPSDIEQ